MVQRITDHHLFSYLKHENENQFIEQALDNRAIFCLLRCANQFIPNHSPIITKLTTATELAAVAEKSKPKVTLPQEYEPFAPVFSKEATTSLPPSQSYNHKINLDETFVPKIGKLYLLTPDERKATEEFIDEHLALGKICPSNSPQASPFFFVKRRMKDYVPAKIINTSMSTLFAMHIHSHLFRTSSINYKKQNSSPSSTCDGGTTMFESKMDTNGRPHSSLTADFLNQQLCSSVFATPWQHFNGS